jgi:hypothetical protein
VDWLLIVSVGVFAVVWWQRVQLWRTRPVPSTPNQRLKTARVLAVALLMLLAIAMRLKWSIDSFDGEPRAPLSLWEHFDRF